MSNTYGEDVNDFDLDLGNQHRLRWVTYADGMKRFGATIFHPDLKKPVEWCASGILWDVLPNDVSPVWQLQGQADEHITVSPSLLCLLCGDHGFIRDGKWVSA